MKRITILRSPGPTKIERETVDALAVEERRTRQELGRVGRGLGVQVPADEILFVPSTPANVDVVTAKRGTPATGDLLTVTNTQLAIDSALAVEDAKLVKVGQRVKISEPDLHVDIAGAVRQVATQNGTNGVDPTKRYVLIGPEKAPSTLVNNSVALKIAVSSTRGKVLTVPTNAVSTGADGDQRVELVAGGGTRTRFVKVDVGLSAQGFIEITPRTPGTLREGDKVVIGDAGPSTALKSPALVPLPPVPAGVGSSSSGAQPGAGTSTAGSAGSTPSAAPGATSTPSPVPMSPRSPGSTATGAGSGP